jgi:hypothetical protein
MGTNAQPLPAGNEREFAEWQRSVDRRIKDVGAQASLPFSISRGGSTQWQTEDGQRVTIFGTFASELEEFIGFVQYDGEEHAMFMTRSDKPGIVLPEWRAPWVKREDYYSCTNPVFEWAFAINPRAVFHEAMRVRFRVDTVGASVGEIRLHEVSSGLSTDVLVTTAASVQLAAFDWAHLIAPNDGATDPSFELQVRLVSGAGPINVHMPDQSDWTSTAFIGAVPTGNARWL